MVSNSGNRLALKLNRSGVGNQCLLEWETTYAGVGNNATPLPALVYSDAFNFAGQAMLLYAFRD